MDRKTKVRQEALKDRRSLGLQTVQRLSAKAQEKVLSLSEFSRANTVAGYVAKPDEVQTAGVLNAALSQGKRVIAPRSDPSSDEMQFYQVESLEDLVPGGFGVLEPPPTAKAVPLSDSQLVLVPVVAWDEVGQRIGYGRGYFDRALKSRGDALAAGLAFELQRHDHIPATSDDARLDLLITEQRVLRFGRNPVD